MLSGLLLAATVAAPVFGTTATTPQTIEARFPGRVLVQVQIDGHPLWFHLDTGTSAIVMDADAARDAGVRDATGDFATADVAVGPFDAKAARVVLVQHYGFDDGGVHVSGLIGTPFLASAVVTIDYPGRQVVAYPAGAFDSKAMHVQALPIDFDGHVARVHAWFGSQEATMLLDTGAQRTIVFEPFADRVVREPLGPQQSITIGIGAHPTWERPFRTKPLLFGGVEFRNAEVLVAGEAPPVLPSDRFDGMMGRDVLQEFRVTLDYRDDVIYLEPR